MTTTYRYISGDTHLEVPAHRWTNRVPAKYRDRAPRTIRLPDGADAFLIEGISLRQNPSDLYGGKGRDDWRPFGQSYESTAGTASAEDRLKSLDIDGMDAEVIFPAVGTGPRAWRSVQDDDAYLAIVRAYNDFIVEEYAAVSPDRLFPVGVIPNCSVQTAIEEMQRCATLGLKSVMLSAFPSGRGHPLPEDDAFWAEALRMRMPLTIHVDIDRSGPRAGPLMVYERRKGIGDAEWARRASDFAGQVGRFAFRGAVNAVQLMVTGVFDRFPDLRILMAENQIGWIPTFMTVADERYERHIDWAQELLGVQPLANGAPSDYIRRHVLWGFQRDPAGVELRHWMGVENLVWGSDFPHQESEYPHSLRVIEENFRNVPEAERHAMVCGNIASFLHLEGAGSQAGAAK